MINNNCNFNYNEPFGIESPIHIKSSSDCASEANEIGRNILIKLSEQSDLLKKTKKNIEENDYFLSKTIRILRTMTWFGWIINFFTRSPQSPCEDYKKEKNYQIKENNIKLEDDNKEDLLNDIDPKIQFEAIINAEDKELSNLENELKNLNYIGLKINEYLVQHNNELDLLIPKSEDLTIKTTTTKNVAVCLTK